MTRLNFTATACDTSILITGADPGLGPFLAIVEHEDGWPASEDGHPS